MDEKIKGMSAIIELVKKVKSEKGLSAADIEKLSGGSIGTSYVNKFNRMTGDETMTLESIQGLSKGLRVPLPVLLEIYYGDSFARENYHRYASASVLDPDWKMLTENEQEHLLETARIVAQGLIAMRARSSKRD